MGNSPPPRVISPDEFVNGLKTAFSYTPLGMAINGSAPSCRFTNLGDTISDDKGRIYGIRDNINNALGIIDDTKNPNSYINKYNDISSKFWNSISEGNRLHDLEISTNSQLTIYQKGEYANAINSLNDNLNKLHPILKQRQDKEQERKTKLDGYIQDYTQKEKEISNLKGQINSNLSTVENINSNISNAKNNLLDSLKMSDTLNTQINDKKNEIYNTSFSIAYFEHLLYEAYLNIFHAVQIQNSSLQNNQILREDQYSTDNSLYVYQKGKVDFYKNVNTGLFYAYYFLIIMLVLVILYFNNTSILIKLTLFRLFVVLLIMYPLFITRFQNLMYYFFGLLYNRLFVWDKGSS